MNGRDDTTAPCSSIAIRIPVGPNHSDAPT